MSDPAVRKCARCDKPMDPAYRPFCSKRCADIDLQKWLTGAYAIPGVETDDESDGEGGGEG
ncbi:MAG: DNA gyrase inhibitor YacG [Caulobacterales bacterium]|nr:DNA gyrase inhibitor YacG [Caulobacterales bacterium]